jgi:uncharacterized protein (TIGR02391 family)
MVKTIFDILPNHEALLALEPEELAKIVLEHLNSVDEKTDGLYLNRHNFSLPHTVQEYPEAHREAITRALMEAWMCLEREGLIIPRPGTDGSWISVSRRGRQITNREGSIPYPHSDLLPRQLLHPTIDRNVWPAFIRGEYDTAVFQAFKEVEVKVRSAGRFLPTDLGVDLMRKAFHPNTGPLTDRNLPYAEHEALQHLFAGAIGSIKNPQSHRNVSISDPVETVEKIILASHFLKIVDSRNVGSGHQGTERS